MSGEHESFSWVLFLYLNHLMEERDDKCSVKVLELNVGNTMLQKELQFYASIKDELLSHHEGKFALIHGEEFVGVFISDSDAYREGIKQFGQEPFLIQYVTVVEETEKYPALVLGLFDATP